MARCCSQVAPRRRAVLQGTVGATSVRPRPGGIATLDAVLDDGSGTVVLRWPGRRDVPGVVPGRQLRVEGTVLQDRGLLVVLNPLVATVWPVRPDGSRPRREPPPVP